MENRKKKTASSTRSNGRHNGKPQDVESVIVKLALTGALDKAAQTAIKRQKKAGLPITFQKGNRIVKHYPNGQKKVLGVVKPDRFKLPEGVTGFDAG